MRKIILLSFIAAFSATSANAQFLNRLTERAAQAAERGVSRAVEKSVEKTTEKATEKVLGGAEKAVEKEADKAAEAAAQAATNATKAYTDGIIQSANEANAAAMEANRINDSIRQATGMASQAAIDYSGLMGSYMSMMGAGTPTVEDKGNEIILSWQYIQFTLQWVATFQGDNCTESKRMYTFQSPELATQYYRGQIEDLDKDEAKNWSVKEKTVTEDNSEEFKGKDRIEIKASMQQIVLSMGGKLE